MTGVFRKAFVPVVNRVDLTKSSRQKKRVNFQKIKNDIISFRTDDYIVSAESEGFEPPEVLPSTVFKTAAFDRSAISRT